MSIILSVSFIPLSKLFTFALVFKFQRVCYLAIPVPGVEDLLTRVVSNHAVVIELVDKLYAWIGSGASGCIIGVVDGCCVRAVVINAVDNTTRDECIPHARHGFRGNTIVTIQGSKGQGIELGSTQLSTVT